MSDLPSDVRKALGRLVLFVDSADAEIKRLTKTEEHLNDTIKKLTARVQSAEQRAFEQEERSRRSAVKEETLTKQVADLTQRGEATERDLTRRLTDAEQRASLYEQRCDELAGQAGRGALLEEAAQKLLAAFERLPHSMKDAGMIQSSSPPEIPLYGTHEWQAVMMAKLGLVETMKEEK